MDWQIIVVSLIVVWAVYTLYRHFAPKKGAGCASGDCGCGPETSISKR